MKNPVIIVLLAALGTLLIIISLTGAETVRQAGEIHAELALVNDRARRAERHLEAVRRYLETARVSVRDYLLDPLEVPPKAKRMLFEQLKDSINAELDQLKPLLEGDTGFVDQLRSELSAYLESAGPILDLSPADVPGGIAQFRRQLRRYRDAAISVADQIAALNNENLNRSQARIEAAQRGLVRYLASMTLTALTLSIVVGVIGGYALSILQKRAKAEETRKEHAEAQLRTLSTQLVRAQEDERKAISRELHDEIGQSLTAVGIEIGNLERIRNQDPEEFERHSEDARRLVQETLRNVRRMAMGLRPSLLDDSGLGAALRWQVREFSRRTGLAVSLDLNDPVLEKLSDRVSTCVYRVVQEALTNCARHSKAKEIRIAVTLVRGMLSVSIQDDGVGFETNSAVAGLGLLGIGERVRELGGQLHVRSEHRRGTRLEIEIPMVREVA